MRTWPIWILLAACGGSKENKEICKKAGDRYLTCVGEILGPDMRAMAASKGDGTAACARDDKTVAMYRKCLPSSTCNEFMDCMTNYAESSQPAIASDKPRKEQCAEHVQQGMRGIANQIMMMDEHAKRSDADKRPVQECLFDDKRPWKECITAPEIAEAKRYADKRQADCEAWEPELAACILRQPNAKSCNEDEYPLWELPVEAGPAGPPVAWKSSVVDAEDYNDEAHLAWTQAKTLIVRDDTGLRALTTDGKELWKRELDASIDDEFALAGNWIVIRDDGAANALIVIDATTGTPFGRALAGINLERHGAGGDKVLVQTDDDQLFELNPSKCKGDKPAKACATRLGQLVTDDTVYSNTVSAIGNLVLMTSSSGIHVADRKGATVHALALDDADTIIPTDDGAAVVYSGRIELLKLVGCARGDDCEIAKLKVSWVNSVDPTPLPGGGIAYNDHGIVEQTAIIEADGRTWTVKTNGRGDVAGDRERIYTVSFGRSAKEPTRLLALSRKTGKVEWQTTLEGAAFDAKEASVTLRDGMAAVRVDAVLYAINVATKT